MTITALAIESSCDETAAAVVRDSFVRSSIVSSQIEVHREFGGVVPELASRHHLGAIGVVVEEALAAAECSLQDLDALVVTEGPGLVGALLVGVQTAKGLAFATGLQLIGVHHMEGHILSTFIGDAHKEPEPFVPHVALLVSGGHTELIDVAGIGRYTLMGATRDDAAGEAYDKVAKLLGLGYPGGPVIDKLAAEGDPQRYAFPRAMITRDNLEFSFSGLKTAVVVHVEREGLPSSRQELADVCASFQAAVSEVLVAKSIRAVRTAKRDRLHIAGGVSANRGLREAAAQAGRREGFLVSVPPLRFCGDNAAMIGAAGIARLALGVRPTVNIHTSLSLDDPRMAIL